MFTGSTEARGEQRIGTSATDASSGTRAETRDRRPNRTAVAAPRRLPARHSAVRRRPPDSREVGQRPLRESLLDVRGPVSARREELRIVPPAPAPRWTPRGGHRFVTLPTFRFRPTPRKGGTGGYRGTATAAPAGRPNRALSFSSRVQSAWNRGARRRGAGTSEVGRRPLGVPATALRQPLPHPGLRGVNGRDGVGASSSPALAQADCGDPRRHCSVKGRFRSASAGTNVHVRQRSIRELLGPR